MSKSASQILEARQRIQYVMEYSVSHCPLAAIEKCPTGHPVESICKDCRALDELIRSNPARLHLFHEEIDSKTKTWLQQTGRMIAGQFGTIAEEAEKYAQDAMKRFFDRPFFEDLIAEVKGEVDLEDLPEELLRLIAALEVVSEAISKEEIFNKTIVEVIDEIDIGENNSFVSKTTDEIIGKLDWPGILDV